MWLVLRVLGRSLSFRWVNRWTGRLSHYYDKRQGFTTNLWTGNLQLQLTTSYYVMQTSTEKKDRSLYNNVRGTVFITYNLSLQYKVHRIPCILNKCSAYWHPSFPLGCASFFGYEALAQHPLTLQRFFTLFYLVNIFRICYYKTTSKSGHAYSNTYCPLAS